ncbi:hypothetical protein Tco_0284754 [Tanacetum coccineum]
MAESSSQILQQQDPHEQPETLPPFKPTPQVGLNMGEITFNPNNEVALLHPLHDNNKYFKLVSDIILKCCIRETFTKSPNQYKEYLSEFWYEEAIETKGTLKKSLLPPRWRLLMAKIIQCLGVNIDFARLIWEDLITKLNKKTRDKVIPYPRFLSLLVKHKMEGYGSENVILNPTQVFNIHNWALKKNNIPKGPHCQRSYHIAMWPILSSLVQACEPSGDHIKAL